MNRIYKYKLRPSYRFVRDAERWFVFCQSLYNAALEERIGAWKLKRKRISFIDQSRQLTEIRSADSDAEAVNRGVSADALRRLDKAMKAFFRRCQSGQNPGFPRFRTRASYNSITFPRMRDGFRINGDKLTCYKLGSVRMRLHRPIEGVIKNCTIIRQVDGWYAAFMCELPLPEPLALTGNQTGVDVGISNFVTISNGERVENPRFLRTAESKFKAAQRRVSRKKLRGKNRKKAQRLLNLHYLKIQRQRINFAHHVANSLVSRFDLIAVENLNINGLAKNNKLAGSIWDAAWATFINILAYKAENAGREIVKVPAAFTSQTCSRCGARQKLNLWQRRYVCVCGLDIDRDHNAAINILNLAGTSPAPRVTVLTR